MKPHKHSLEREAYQSEVHALAERLEGILLSLRNQEPSGEAAGTRGESHLVVQFLQVVADRLVGLERMTTEIRELLVGQRQEKEWYSTRELAEIMGKSDYTIREHWCNDGRIECEKDPTTGKWRIPGHEVRRLTAGGSILPKRSGKV